MGLRNRLALFLIATLIAVQCLTAFLVYGVLRDRLIDQGKQELRAATQAFKRELDTLSRRVTETVEVLALDYPFRQAIAQRDHDTALSVLRNHGLRVGASRMILVDLDGGIEADTATNAGTETFPFPGLLRDAAMNGKGAALAALGGTICWTVVVPVLAPIPIAYVAACVPIDQTFLSNLSTLSSLPISVALSAAPGKFEADRHLPNGRGVELLRSSPPSAESVGMETKNGQEALTLTSPLSTVAGSAPILATFDYPMAEALRPYSALITPMILVLTISLAVALAGTALIAHGLTRPISSLAAAARRIAQGDYTPPANIPKRDEVGQLATAITVMVKAIGQREAALTSAINAVETARDEAVEANSAKSKFLANMSHELRTPLNAVIGFAEVMQGELMGPLGSAPYKEYSRHIAASGRHLLQLVEEMFDLTKIEAGKLSLSPRALDIAALIRDVQTLLGAAAESAGVRLLFEHDALMKPQIEADPVKLKQVLLNLIGNAIKFTPKGGQVSAQVTEAGEDIEIRIADTGIGIAAEDIPRVIKPFFRVSSAYNGTYQGAGLGLPLAKAIVEQHGGRLAIESKPGRGTTVLVCLPRRAPSAHPSHEAA